MTAFHLSLLIVILVIVLYLAQRFDKKKPSFHSHQPFASKPTSQPPAAFPMPKPAWVKDAVLQLHCQLRCSHRKLAAQFNRIYLAQTGISVGRTWVRETIKQYEYEKLHVQKTLRHRLPWPVARNCCWGIDTTCITDETTCQHIVFGIVDHGTRLNLTLRPLKRFNTWTFLGTLFLAFGEFGKPTSIKSDNCMVFHAKWVKRVLACCRVKQRYSAPGKPWQNGKIERFFGTLKSALQKYTIKDRHHLLLSMAQFQRWYNCTRPHQHLAEKTPNEAWNGIDPGQTAPKKIFLFTTWDGRLRGILLRR